MRQFHRSYLVLIALFTILLIGFWLAFRIQSQSLSLDLNNSLWLVGGASLGFLLIGVESVRLAITPAKPDSTRSTILTIFLLSYLVPAALLGLPAWLTVITIEAKVYVWLDALPNGSLILQTAAALFILLFRQSRFVVDWLKRIIPEPEQKYLWLAGIVSALGCALSFQFLLNFYQMGVLYLIHTWTSQSQGQGQNGLQIETGAIFSTFSTAEQLFLILSAILVIPFVNACFFRGFIFTRWQTWLGGRGAALVISFLYAVLQMRPLVLLPCFFLMLILFSLDHWSRHPLPAFLAHAGVNILVLFLDWRWII